MTADPDLLAALLTERQDYRWFATPPKAERKPADITVARDDEVTCARRRRVLVEAADIHRAAS